MGTPEASREPCPDRILDDVGGAFGMGAVGGSAWYFIKGLYNSPKGARFVGATQAARLNAPRLGGSFAVWGGLFSTFDCSMVYIRQKEDPWNSIAAGFTTGGFLSLRQGIPAATRAAVFGGVLLALIEGAGIMLSKLINTQPVIIDEPMPGYPPGTGFPGHPAGLPAPPPPPSADSESKPFFSGFFGRKNKEEPASGGGSETKILESFDAPPVPKFEYK